MKTSLLAASMIQLAGPTGVGYGEEAIIKLQGGLVYQILELETNLVKKATLKKVTVDIGGTPVAYYSGKDLELNDKLFNLHETTGRFCIDLSKFRYRTLEGIHVSGLKTSQYDDITLKVEFGAKDAADPADLTLKGKAYVSPNPQGAKQGGGRIMIPQAYEVTQYTPAAGDYDWSFPNGSPNLNVQHMIIDESEVSISKVIVKRGATTIREMHRSDIDHGLQRYAGVTPQPGKLLLDFTQFGFGKGDSVETANLNFTFTVDAKGALKTRIEGFKRVA
ncbi:hypothetical protein HMF8227_01451 [Saliniradius amylolyticus]|uniref:Uncharacterized protein n=1 Tax=Saliniradius amylolyticus TaxID=2183582 RepID=A0A2S2E2P0_9ALTE|nr:major capsid protein P2 [Saliniradius amylolyticus]AWL11926.1 hypothetical protein HMF8227_01451 [Saliniradius amylolyticus]